MYKPLIYYNQSPNSYDHEFQKRFNDYASIHLPFKIKSHVFHEYFEAFYVNHSSLDYLNNTIYRNSKTICSLQNSLPDYAIKDYIKYLTINEIISTNRIEGIFIKDTELLSALDTFHFNELSMDSGKNLSFIKMYYSLHDSNKLSLSSPEDIRKIYNELIFNEVNPTTFLDGDLFRSQSVYITSHHDQVVHKGIEPESNIISNLSTLLNYLQNHRSAILYKIAIAHFVFGYIHPFYDGNGRTSRFISNMLLSREIDLLTALSLSQSIENYQKKYYESFDISNNPVNKGELTFFCMNFLQFIEGAQTTIINELTLNQDKLKRLNKILSTLSLPNVKTTLILRIIGTNYIFGIKNRGINKRELKEYSKIPDRTLSRITRQLYELNLITYVNKNPLTMTLSDYLQHLFET